VLHPVGPLPTAVYWRRRLLVLVGTLGVLGGGGWLGVAVASGDPGSSDPASSAVAAAGATSAAPTPALEQVLPSLAAVQVPTAVPTTTAPAPVTTAPPAGPVAGGPCTDDMISVDVRPESPTSPVGGKPTFDLVVTNVSPVACVRALDKGLQEIVLLDGAGDRLWGSNDCFPEASTDPRTLAPGEVVTVPLVWGGLTSEPTCTAPRGAPPAGSYVVRGRLDTKVSPDAPLTLT
jgi:hypothetical protein